MKRKGFQKIFTPFLATIFALSGLFPTQFALALKDCGNHEIVSCKTHDDKHFVALHTSNEADIESSSSKNALNDNDLPTEEHDAAHQIEKTKLPLSTVSTTPLEGVKILYVAQDSDVEIVAASRLRETKWPNGPPVLTNSFLRFLPSIRLQV